MAKRQPPTAKTSPKNEVTTFQGYEDYEGAGFTDQGGEDLLIPFIDVLQRMSPQLEEIPGAKPGNLFNTVTSDLYPQGITFVPAYRDWNFVEWVPRTKGGGFVAAHAPTSDIVRRARAEATAFGQYYTPAGNELQETFYLYVVTEPGATVAVLPFRSTKIRPYKALMTRLRTMLVDVGDRKITPPLMAFRLTLNTVSQKNNKGEWFNFLITPANGDLRESMITTDHALFQAANELRLMVEKGKATAAYETTTNASADSDDDAPF